MLFQKIGSAFLAFYFVSSLNFVSPNNEQCSEEKLKCYEENCSKRQDQWRCKNKKPLEKDCNEFCHEFTHEGSHNDIYQIIRDCSKINQRNASEIRKIVDKKGKYCTKSRNSRYCYCNQSLCNKKIKLPDKFEVV